ncbi:MAG: hypothetical protein ACI9R3_000032 [Verrucomicrobiales bacterium]|jgi:hypothetical protein
MPEMSVRSVKPAMFVTGIRFKLLVSLVVVLGFALLPTPYTAMAQDGNAESSKKAKKKKKGKKVKEEEKSPTMADAIGNVTPVGRGHSELVIPQFDPETGKRISTIEVRKVQREDEVSLRLLGLNVQEYGPDGEESMRIEVRSGYFDLLTGILTGDSYSKVTVAGQFEIVGTGLVYDTSTTEVDGKKVRADVGRMNGPVRMTIFGGGKMSMNQGEKKEPKTEKQNE